MFRCSYNFSRKFQVKWAQSGWIPWRNLVTVSGGGGGEWTAEGPILSSVDSYD